jgi:hypothetical protein
MEKINKKQNSWKINPKFMECHNPFMFQATNQNLTKKTNSVQLWPVMVILRKPWGSLIPPFNTSGE